MKAEINQRIEDIRELSLDGLDAYKKWFKDTAKKLKETHDIVFGEVDLESPYSEDEKESEELIALAWSGVNQVIKEKRRRK